MVVPIPSVNVNERYGAENVTVILELTKEQNVLYNMIVTPDSFVQRRNENNTLSALLMASYNIVYSVQFVAISSDLCAQSSTKVVQLHYGEFFFLIMHILMNFHLPSTLVSCGPPLDIHKNAVVSGYSPPALVGSNVTICCPIEMRSKCYYNMYGWWAMGT